jgi:vitamin B12 transporter
MGTHHHITGAGLALAALLAQPANAQQTSADKTFALPTISVSATTLPTPVREIGSSVTVITAADIERQQQRTVSDVLNTVPGLQVVQNGSLGTQTSVFMRGTNSNHIKVLIDGIDISDASTPSGAIDFGQLVTSDIERIEVLRGPQSGLYGSDAIGGVISITTKKGSGPAKATGYLEGGSFKTFNQALGVSGSKERFDYAFNASHFRSADMPVTPGYMVPPGASAIGNLYDNTTLSTKLGADATDNLRFNLIGRYSDAKLNYSSDDPNAFPGKTYATQSTANTKDFYGRAEAVAALLDGRFINTFGVNYTDHNRDNQDPNGNPPSTFKSNRKDYNWRGNFVVMPGETLVAGLNREDDQATSPNINSIRTGNQGGFLELQSEVAKRFFVVANVRHDDHDAFGGHNTWRIAPAYIVPVTETKLKASYGTGFHAPTLYQLYGVGSFGYVGKSKLAPETSRGYDFGFEQPMFDDRVQFGVTFYRNNITNLINNVFFPVNSYVNVGQALTYGAEAFVAVTVTKELRMRLDYTRTTARDVIADTELLRRPSDKYTVSADWQPTDRLTITPSLFYLGPWMDIDRSTFVTKRTSSVTLVNLAASYKVDDTITVFARANNLLNKVYENPLGWEQPGFAVFGGIKLSSR